MESNLGLGKCLVVVCRYFYLDTAEMIGLCLVLCLCWAHWGGGPHWAQPVPALFYPVLDISLQHWHYCDPHCHYTIMLQAWSFTVCVPCFSAVADEYLTTTDILQPGPGTCAGEPWSGLILPPLSQRSTLTDEGGRELITLYRTNPIPGNNCQVIFIKQSTFDT